MFKLIEICLTEPICNCEEECLRQTLTITNGKISAQITCKTCNTILHVPHDKYVHTFILDRPYKKRLSNNILRNFKLC